MEIKTFEQDLMDAKVKTAQSPSIASIDTSP